MRFISGQCGWCAIAEVKQLWSVIGWMIKISRVPPCFGRHFKLLVPPTFAVVSTPFPRRVEVMQADGQKNNWQIFVTTW
jgi:hypothetical protein